MAGKDDDAEKSHEPTQHKLDQARKKGEVARSADLNTAATYGGFLLVALVVGTSTIKQISGTMMGLVDRSSELSRLVFAGSGQSALSGVFVTICLAISAWFLVPGVMAILSTVAQRSFVVAPDKLKPRLSRINPLANARNKFGPSGLFEFSKSLLKLSVYTCLLGLFLRYHLSDMSGALHAEPAQIGALISDMLMEFMFVVLLIALVIGALDFVWHKFDHLRRNRMSHKEVRDEHKQNEGDPHLKQERRQRASRIAMDQMMADVPDADVVVVNPTHFAVALKWSRQPGSAPTCVAKGQDHVALAIRDCAHTNGVPVRHDPPTARALYATTEIGQEIAPDHYRAVAAAIRFAEAMRKRARRFG